MTLHGVSAQGDQEFQKKQNVRSKVRLPTLRLTKFVGNFLVTQGCKVQSNRQGDTAKGSHCENTLVDARQAQRCVRVRAQGLSF